MALLTTKRTSPSKSQLRHKDASSSVGFLESQKLARQKGYGKRAKRCKLNLEDRAGPPCQMAKAVETFFGWRPISRPRYFSAGLEQRIPTWARANLREVVVGSYD